MKNIKLVVFLGCILWIIMLPSGQSLWIDEAITAKWASHESLGDLFCALLQDNQSDSQMPFFIFFSWVNAQIFGTAEWQLRLPNLLWGILSVVSLYFTGRKFGIWWLPALCVIMPFFVFYMDEARPYAMQIGISCWLLYAMVACMESKGQGKMWPWHLGFSGVLLCSASMLGVVTLGAVVIMLAVVFLHQKWRIKQETVFVLLGFFVLIGLLGIYFAWTLMRGAGGARLWNVGVANLGFAILEFSGATGLSEPRHILRDLAKDGQYGVLALKFAGPASFFGILYFFMFGLPIYGLRKSRFSNYWIAMALVVVNSFFGLFILALIAKWPFWGRHLAPAFPFFVTWLALSAVIIYKSNRRITAIALAGILAIGLLVASINVHFNQRFHNEDFRSAATIAKEQVEQGKVVWWVAEKHPGLYYGLSIIPFDEKKEGIINAINLSPSELENDSRPHVIVYSRPADYDRYGTISQLIKQDDFQEKAKLRGLVVYERK
jgi:hypothetical protein